MLRIFAGFQSERRRPVLADFCMALLDASSPRSRLDPEDCHGFRAVRPGIDGCHRFNYPSLRTRMHVCIYVYMHICMYVCIDEVVCRGDRCGMVRTTRPHPQTLRPLNQTLRPLARSPHFRRFLGSLHAPL